MAKIISVVNFKGGVAKSTTAFNLAAALWMCGKRVLIVDADPQYELTTRIGFNERDAETMYEWMLSEGTKNELPAPIYNRYAGNEDFCFIPSSPKVSNIEQALVTQPNRFKSPYMILRNLLHKYCGDFDYIFLDCPPSPGFMNNLALIASDDIIVPVECAGESIDGLIKLDMTIQDVKEQVNPDLTIKGYLLTKYDDRTKITRKIREEISEEGLLLNTKIRSSIKFKEAGMFYKNIFEYDPNGNGAEDYMSLAEELFDVKRPDNWKTVSAECWEKTIGSQTEDEE